MLIIDGDGHFIGPATLWADYLDARLREAVEIVEGEDGKTRSIVIDGFPFLSEGFWTPEHPFGPGDFLTSGGAKHPETYGRTYDDAAPAGWDAAVRLKVHDENRIHAAVLFASMGLFAGLHPNPDVAYAMCRAINTWVHDEYAAHAPDEIYIIATLPYRDPQRAAAELRRCVEDLGFVAGMVFTSPTPDGKVLSDESYDVLYATAVDLGVPICVHSAASRNPAALLQLTGDRPGTFLLQRAAIHTFESMYHFGSMYENRVFDRHTDLKVGYMEASCGWVPFWAERLQEAWEAVGWNARPPISRGEIDVFREQCVVGCEGEERMVGYVQDMFGENSVTWASDFPHWDTEPPYTKDMLKRDDLSTSQLKAVMTNAAIDFYHVDVDRIRRSHEARGSLNPVP